MLIIKHLRIIQKLIVAKFTGRRIPLVVVLCVTNKCNLSCWYCYGEHPYRKDWQEFTTEELLDIVRTLSKLGTQVIQIQGGEPLLRSDLDVVIKEIKKLGMVCDMVTNGTLISERKDIIRLLNKICISLDGPEIINDRNRGKGTFALIEEGIKISRSFGLPVRISTVLTSDSSIEDIDWLIKFSTKNKAVVNFSPSFEFIPQTRSKLKPHVIADKNLRILFEHIIDCKSKGASIQFSAKSYEYSLNWPFTYGKRMLIKEEIPLGFEYPKCYHGEYVFFIDSDGSLYPCCNFWGRPKFNIRVQGLRESIFNVNRQGCKTCYIPSYVDRNLFFDFKPSIWWNYIKQAIRGGV
ncbi:MAG: radical SAM protein [Candidatus Omnitrophica bacterium]|nr:radical SAM protein [Candidatus Omnitrophota bacterium]MCK5493132.1 radical SAM protein [Candidatus Omnitrophota bacterium]